MPRRRHDSLSKDLLSEWLEPVGKVESPGRVQGEERQIDLVFTALPKKREPRGYRQQLGLLDRMARGVAALEAFRNPCTADELRACVVKLVELHGVLKRRARRHHGSPVDVPLPHLWALTPSFSEELQRAFRAEPRDDLPPGCLGLGEAFGTTVVVLSRLPATPETLWLRLLGRGQTQQRALAELDALPDRHPLRHATLRRVLLWRAEAIQSERPTDADRELLMNTERLVAQWEKRVRKEGLEEGKVDGLFVVLKARGLEPSEEQAEQIRACRDARQLDRWLRRAATATSVDEVFATPAPPRATPRRPRR